MKDVKIISSSQGDISNFKQAEFVKEERPNKVSPDNDPFGDW